MRTVFHLIKTYPQQAFLLVFNTGVFAWLQLAGQAILNQFGWSQSLMANSPDWLQGLAGGSLDRLHGLISSGPIAWLVASLILTLIIRFVKGLIKWTLFILIILVGLYLIGQYQGALG
ncbi:hypothetical protein [Streptococcus sp. DD12]|uniref:hypothetical protein n=1 Tax=Streptococcus sp. DD12 TaxID=1777880 RepID=UPI0007954FF9|nr:hypothetical protein [Streptococcus sp. DD12]KXT77006.1 hypothetical protein STRDD12_00140 [Streptococcus sp. DD12]